MSKGRKRSKFPGSKRQTKRRKISDQNNYEYNLKFFFDNLPQELWVNHVISSISKDWLFVSRKYNQIATNFLLSDQRIIDRITDPNSGPAYFGLAHYWKSETLLQFVLKLSDFNPVDNYSSALRKAAGRGTITGLGFRV